MIEIKQSSRFKKDLKRYKHQKDKLKALAKVLGILKMGAKLPLEYYPHYLKGAYEGCMECHIEGDFLLIWIDEDSHTIKLLRLGSHSELFG